MIDIKANKSTQITSKKVAKVVFTIVSILACIIILFPIIWMLPSVFKGQKEMFSVPITMFPKKFTFENFTTVFQLEDFNFFSSIFSTLGVALSGMLLSLLVNMAAAYGFARFNFPFKKVLWSLMLVTMFIPGITILLTSAIVVNKLGMMNTFWVLVLPGVANAYNIFFFRQFFLGFPTYLEEASVLDGMTRYGIFFRIFIPLSVTPMVIVGASVFMGYWNSFLWPTITITDSVKLKQIMQFIRELNAKYGNKNYGVVLAATLISLIVPLIIFCFAQRQIVQGIAITGLK